ncbi:ABC transporter ATP-binding protein [Flexivirga oryzae]|uniref:ABC-2 type transport system ATP-binding protein n=1 Tax=Flexivirga oryzae TaxID=1794944 RepID=A0A839N4C8_9MICO|nr:ATP-binding cassette domain-containing protein [Flexivirga oryzae]MBB2890496.1 ABC-2 type transport system ATP-binding protein [Flexivirga oryzae]
MSEQAVFEKIQDSRPGPGRPGTDGLEVVAVTGLTKRYGRRTVVDGVDLHLAAGSITGLIGPNGAGKTTIMSMLLGLVRPTAGRGTVLGHDLTRPADYLSRVGALIEGPAFFGNLSGRANLQYFARLGGHDLAGIPEVLDLVGLQGREGDSYSSYSLGMKQRLGIGVALLGDPDLVILDEPTNGVDPAGMRDIRAMVRRIAADGRTVLISSHLLAELEHVCDRVIVLDQGGLRYSGPLHELPSSRAEVILLRGLSPEDDSALHRLLTAQGRTVERRADGFAVDVGDDEPERLAGELSRHAIGQGVELVELHHQKQSLEDRVLDLVGTGSRS